jgi:hypothetical protein
MEKICTKCNKSKEINNYYWENTRQRYKTTCISCEKERSLKRFKENPEKVKANNKKWIENNKNRFKQLVKNNRGKYKEYDKKYYQKNKEKNKNKIKLKNKEWLEKNPNYYKEKRKNEKEKFKTYDNQYKKEKRKNNSNFKIKECISSNINYNIRRYKKLKNEHSLKYLGCSIEEYIIYLEGMFLQEMNWENHGDVWEIDHIKPISIFDFSIEENIYKAFNYQNTQPLFKTTEIAESFGYINQIGNRNKSNKYE